MYMPVENGGMFRLSGRNLDCSN